MHDLLAEPFGAPTSAHKCAYGHLWKLFVWRWAALCAILLWPSPAQGQRADTGLGTASAPRSLNALRTPQPIWLDGVLDEAIWRQADVADALVQLGPNPGAPATEASRVSILYDDEALYVGARLLDSAPDSIVARLARRDEDVFSDWFFVSFDSYDDNRTAFSFGVNPRGVKRDLLIFDDTREDSEWDAVWDVAVRQDSLGWVAEYRIPLSQLRFRRTGPGESLIWGVNFQRRIARRDEVDTWAPLSPDVDRRVSLFGELLGLRELRPGRQLSLLPYAMVGATREPERGDDPFHRSTDPFTGVGGDLEYSVTPSLTVAATLNPDFGQVEADPSVVNLTAFETFVPEKRPFFLEGAEIFDVKGPQLFYSRRIGRQPRGGVPGSAVYEDAPEQTTILGAAKLTGRTGSGWSIGVLSAVTAEEQARYTDTLGVVRSLPVEPRAISSVLRLTRNLRDGRTVIGGIATAVNRPSLPEPLDYLPVTAYASGLDLRHGIAGGTHEIALAAYGSHVQGSAPAITRLQLSSARFFQRPDADHVRFDPTRIHLSGWNAEARLRDLSGPWQWTLEGIARSPGFEVNDIGFLSRVDVLEQRTTLVFSQSSPRGPFRRYRFRAAQQGEWTFGRERTGAQIRTEVDADLRSLWNVFARVQHSRASFSTTALRGGPALYKDPVTAGTARLRTDRRKSLWGEMTLGYANAHGSTGYELGILPVVFYRPATNLELSLHPEFAIRRTPDQFVVARTVEEGREFLVAEISQRTASLTTRASYALGPTLSLQFYVQPFVSAASFTRYARVADPRAAPFGDRFDPLGDRLLQVAVNTYGVDLNRDGVRDLTFPRPDFNSRQFRSTLVARWEYAPGSTLFAVWSRGQSDRLRLGDFDLGRDFVDLVGLDSTNTLLIKVSYWIGL